MPSSLKTKTTLIDDNYSNLGRAAPRSQETVSSVSVVAILSQGRVVPNSLNV